MVYQRERTLSYKQDILVGNLLPERKYWVRINSVSYTGIRGTNPPTASITLKAEPFRPRIVSGLELASLNNGAIFGGTDIKFIWRRSGAKSGAGTIPAGKEVASAEGSYNQFDYFKDFRVEILVNNVRKRVEYTTTPAYTYTYEKNVEDNSNIASRSVKVQVWERNIFNQESSTPATLSVSNTAPTMAGFSPTLTAVLNSVQVDWSSWQRTDIDLDKFEIFADTFNPPTTKRGEVSTSFNNFWMPTLTSDTLYYVSIKPYDLFGAGTGSSVVSATSGGLSTKSTLAMRGVTVEGLKWTVHETPNRVDWPTFVIRWKKIDGSDTNVTITASNATWSTGTLYIYWVENSSTLSTTTNAITALADGNVVLVAYKGGTDFVSGAGFGIPATYITTAIISDLAVTDAKIDSLSANKLVANSVITNLLGVGDINRFLLDGTNRQILIKDNQATPVNRVKLGKISAGATDYGLEIYNASGQLMVGLTGAETVGVVSNAITNSATWADSLVTSSTSGTWVDIGSLSITATGGLPMVVWAKTEIGVNGGAAGEYRVLHNESSSEIDLNTHGSSDTYYRGSPFIGIYTPTVGISTFKLQMRVANGVGTVFARNRKIVVVELKR